MYDIQIDLKKNRLLFTLRGQPGLQESADISNELLAALHKLKPGFNVITQVRSFYPLDSITRLILENTMKMARQIGLKTAIHVSPNPIVQRQWQDSSHTAGYEAYECGSLTEAEEILNRLDAGEE